MGARVSQRSLSKSGAGEEICKDQSREGMKMSRIKGLLTGSQYRWLPQGSEES